MPFNNLIYDKMKDIRINENTTLYDYFNKGQNIGTCGASAVLLSLLFNEFTIVSGKMTFLEGTTNSPKGEHTWLEVGNLIYDTSLGVVVRKDTPFGYEKENEITKDEMLLSNDYKKMRKQKEYKELIDPTNNNIKGIMTYLLNAYLNKNKTNIK